MTLLHWRPRAAAEGQATNKESLLAMWLDPNTKTWVSTQVFVDFKVGFHFPPCIPMLPTVLLLQKHLRLFKFVTMCSSSELLWDVVPFLHRFLCSWTWAKTLRSACLPHHSCTPWPSEPAWEVSKCWLPRESTPTLLPGLKQQRVNIRWKVN